MPEIATKEIVERWLRQFAKEGAEKQYPNGLKIEKKGEAPELVGFASPVAAVCCTLGDKTISFPDSEMPIREPIDELPPTLAVRVSLKVAYRGHQDNGIKSIFVDWLTADGGFGSFFGGHAIWRPTDAEKQQSTIESISRNFSMCIPCTAFISNATVRFAVFVEDESGNSSIQVLGVAPGAAKVGKCCK